MPVRRHHPTPRADPLCPSPVPSCSVTPEFCEVKMGRDGRSRGYAVARFASVGDAAKAMEGCSEVELEGRKLIIRVDEKAGQE